MAKYNRFDAEQRLLKFMGFIDDLDVLVTGILEYDMTPDQVANALLGIIEISKIRSDQVWNDFEECIKDDFAKRVNDDRAT